MDPRSVGEMGLLIELIELVRLTETADFLKYLPSGP